MSRHIFIDCEWTLDQEIFLIGYAYRYGTSGSLYGRSLTKATMKRILRGVRYIYVYGPDIAYLEKNFDINFRRRYFCVNMLKLVRLIFPNRDSYKLADIEKHFKISRTTRKYKTSVFTIWKDWHDKTKREHVIRYNMEDARNLREVFYHLENKISIPFFLIEKSRLT